MAELLSLEALAALAILILIQMTLGYHGLLLTQIEARRAPEPERARLARLGLGVAIAGRLVLVVAAPSAVWAATRAGGLDGGSAVFGAPGYMEVRFGVFGVFLLAAGAAAIAVALSAAARMLGLRRIDVDIARRGQKTGQEAMLRIVALNTALAAVAALTALAVTPIFVVAALSLVVAALLMLAAAERPVAAILAAPGAHLLGLAALLVAGLRLLGLGAEAWGLHLLGARVEAMSSTTLLFSIAALAMVIAASGGFRKKLLAARNAEIERAL